MFESTFVKFSICFLFCLGTVLSHNVGAVETMTVAFVGDIGTEHRGESKSVLNLIRDEGAELTILTGDIAYNEDDSDGARSNAEWLEYFDKEVGKDHVLFVAPGNHDIRKNDHEFWMDERDGWGTLLEERLKDQGNDHLCESWDKESGADSDVPFGYATTCTYKGLLVYTTVHGSDTLDGVDTVDYAEDVLAHHSDPIWKICAFHKVLKLFQVGSKDSEVMSSLYEVCRWNGAIILTSHEHTYARTYTVVRYEGDDPLYVTERTLQTGRGDSSDSPLILRQGQSVNILTGTGGISLDDRVSSSSTQNGWWGQTVENTYGATFCEFKSYDSRNAHCYYKDIDGRIRDEYYLRSMIGENPCRSTTNKEIDVMFAIDTAASTDYDKFKAQLDFVMGVVSSLNIGQYQTHAGVISVNSEFGTEVVINPDEYHDKSELMENINLIDFESEGKMNMAAAIGKALDAQGLRNLNGNCFLIFIIDKSSEFENLEDVSNAYRLAKDAGWRILLIRVGRTNSDLDTMGESIFAGELTDLQFIFEDVSGYICESEEQSSGQQNEHRRPRGKSQSGNKLMAERGPELLGKVQECARQKYIMEIDSTQSRTECHKQECILISTFKLNEEITERDDFAIIYEEHSSGGIIKETERVLCDVRDCPLEGEFELTYVYKFDDVAESGTYDIRIRGSERDDLVCTDEYIEYTRPTDVDCGVPDSGVCFVIEDSWLIGERLRTTLVYSAEECCCLCDKTEECMGWAYDFKVGDVGRSKLAKAVCILTATNDYAETNIGWLRGRKSSACIRVSDGRLVGDVMKNYRAENKAECCHECRYNDECGGWTFESGSGRCEHMSRYGDMDVLESDNWVYRTDDWSEKELEEREQVGVRYKVLATVLGVCVGIIALRRYRKWSRPN